MHSEPVSLCYPGLGEYYEPDAVSCIPVPIRHYAPEPARDDIPNLREDEVLQDQNNLLTEAFT